MKNITGTVQEIYQSLHTLEAYNQSHNVVRRCGYESAREMWDENLLISGEIIPTQLGLFIDDFTKGYLEAAKEGAEVIFDATSLRKTILHCRQEQKKTGQTAYGFGAELWRREQENGKKFVVKTGLVAFIV